MSKKVKILIIIAIVVAATIAIVLMIKPNKEKSFDIEELRKQSLSYYEDYELRILDFMDMTALFGIDKDNDENSMFLANISNEEIKKEDMFILIVMNTNDSDYYDIFQSYVDSEKNYEDNEKILELFNNSILKKGKNYTYFILGDNPKEIEKDILLQYK
ncbi:MAG: hypothetical protein IKR57_06090 [Bacilli bacterium]|nr:hypothetical protein [Bacilli bacterium]